MKRTQVLSACSLANLTGSCVFLADHFLQTRHPAFDAGLQPIANVAPRTARANLVERWDGADLRDVRGTYGDYLIGKVAKVFPNLGRTHLGTQP